MMFGGEDSRWTMEKGVGRDELIVTMHKVRRPSSAFFRLLPFIIVAVSPPTAAVTTAAAGKWPELYWLPL